jgi:cobalamin biosynthesis Mg chelatase CobN
VRNAQRRERQRARAAEKAERRKARAQAAAAKQKKRSRKSRRVETTRRPDLERPARREKRQAATPRAGTAEVGATAAISSERRSVAVAAETGAVRRDGISQPGSRPWQPTVILVLILLVAGGAALYFLRR